MTSRDLVKWTFQRRSVPRPPWLPLVGTYLTRVEGGTTAEVLTDPGRLHQALHGTQQLLRADAIVFPLDPTLEAEALGAKIGWETGLPVVEQRLKDFPEASMVPERWMEQGRVQVILEAAHRTCQIEGRHLPVFASVTGPVTVFSQVLGSVGEVGDDARKVQAHQEMMARLEMLVRALVQLVKAYAEAGVAGIVVNEVGSVPNAQAAPGDSDLTKLYRPLWNAIKFHNMWAVMRWHVANAKPPAGADAVTGTDPPARSIAGLEIGTSFWADPEANMPTLHAQVRQRGQKGVFLTTVEPLNQEDVLLSGLLNGIDCLQTEARWLG
ncbi:MAG: hypothetical protein K6T68_07660 [Alicyclobacillus shizuokensis]|nr:hypothetical protein [Alicyclobacillus shizuokensis]